MKTTCSAGVHSSTRRYGLVVVAAIGLASCGGGDSPEVLGEALAEASGSIEWVADEERACVGDAVLADVGFEVLQADGVTSQALATSPSTVEQLIEEGSAELGKAVESCIDADRLFRASLASDLSIDVAECDADFAGASIAIANRAAVLSGGDPLELEDTPEHRDLLRPCLEDAAFGVAFGLDSAADLEASMQAALPVGLREISVSDDCLAARIVGKFGVETLDDLGISVETPDLDLDVFTAEEAVSIRDAAETCSDAVSDWRRDLVNTNEPLADCVVAAVGDQYTVETVAIAFGESGARRARERLVEDGLETCADDRAADVFDSLSSLDQIEADFLARTLLENWSRNGAYDYLPSEDLTRCSMRGTYATLGRATVDELFADWSRYEPGSDAAIDALLPFWAALRDSERACWGDWFFITSELHAVGTSPETLDCIRERLGDDATITEMADTLVAYVTTWDDYRWESVLSEIDASFDRCRTEDELRIYHEWHNYMLGHLDLTENNNGVDSA